MKNDTHAEPQAKAAHTPGPWQIHRYENVFRGEVLAITRQGDSRKSLIADVGPSEFGPGRSECEANAALISAAPETKRQLEEAHRKLSIATKALSYCSRPELLHPAHNSPAAVALNALAEIGRVEMDDAADTKRQRDELLAALKALSVACRDAGKTGTEGNLAKAEAEARDAIARAEASEA